MFLRKLLAVLCPTLLCLVCCVVFRWLDTLMAATEFWSLALKGVLLGVAIALLLPIAGISTRNNGLIPWLYGAAALLLALLVYQRLEIAGVVHVPVLLALISINGQVLLAESATLGFLVVTALMNGKRRR